MPCRARDLKRMERIGIIAQLREKVPYNFDALKYGNGEPVQYVADFVYRNERGHQVVEGNPAPLFRGLMLVAHGIRVHQQPRSF